MQVFCVHSEPNFSLPWQRRRQNASSSSGFIISGKRVLTNAHSVDFATQVKVKRRGSDTKYVAQVLSIAPECDLAILTVEDATFWEDVVPLQFGRLPRLQDDVIVVGYPIGGDTISVTSGVVSRIEMTQYAHSAHDLLGVQIDAAINSGNSGGPVFNKRGECVGVAFQSLKDGDAEAIGWLIPTPVIEHFIGDFDRSGTYSGFPVLGVEWQKTENPTLRKELGMRSEQKGVLVKRIEPTAAAFGVLSKGDVLMKFDGVQIAADGTCPFRVGERIAFNHLVASKYVGDTARLTVLHDGKERVVDVLLAPPKRLVPVHTRGLPPSYFILAGLVFIPVSVPFLRSEYGKEYDYDAPVKLLDRMMFGMASSSSEEVVVISQVRTAEEFTDLFLLFYERLPGRL